MTIVDEPVNKWICKKCGYETNEKPHKNQLCSCGGRFRKSTRCALCGSWFYNDKGRKFCVKCSPIKNRKQSVNLICDFCGKEYKNYFSNTKKNTHNFCSKECKTKYFAGDKIKRHCLYCGKEFEIYKCSLKSNATGHYCSRECYANSMAIPREYNMRDFRKAKKELFPKRQLCAICGTPRNVHIHHIIPNRITSDQSKENLIPLCAKHHLIVERHTRELLKDFTDYELLQYLLNCILRQRQSETLFTVGREIKNGKFED